MRRFILKWAARVFLLAAFIVLAEAVFFYNVLTRAWTPENSDLAVVFAGADFRIEKGYKIANACKVRFLTISPRTKRKLDVLNRKYKKSHCFRNLIEDRANTTFQNALFVAKIIKREHFKSVILVTHTVHMPRSFLLLRLQSVGRGVSIHPAPVEPRPFARSPFDWTIRQKKIAYNEMVELWGSLYEMVLYKVSGQLSQDGLKKSPFVSFLRSMLLFEV